MKKKSQVANEKKQPNYKGQIGHLAKKYIGWLMIVGSSLQGKQNQKYERGKTKQF